MRRSGLDGRRVVQRLVNGDTALDIPKSFGCHSTNPVSNAARAFIVEKLGVERYETLAKKLGMGPVQIARALGREALQKG